MEREKLLAHQKKLIERLSRPAGGGAGADKENQAAQAIAEEDRLQVGPGPPKTFVSLRWHVKPLPLLPLSLPLSLPLRLASPRPPYRAALLQPTTQPAPKPLRAGYALCARRRAAPRGRTPRAAGQAALTESEKEARGLRQSLLTLLNLVSPDAAPASPAPLAAHKPGAARDWAAQSEKAAAALESLMRERRQQQQDIQASELRIRLVPPRPLH
jgi:hypothetical protein